MQNYQDIEIICIDDGSTDNSLAILKEWEAKDSRIHIFQQQNNGPSAARNKGLKFARGEYITFVDADDMVKKGIYATSMKLIQKNNLDVFSFAIESYPSGNIRKTSFPMGTVLNPIQLFLPIIIFKAKMHYVSAFAIYFVHQLLRIIILYSMNPSIMVKT